MIIGSMDVEALYPSIGINRSAEIVGQMVGESRIKIENIDYETAVCFIASNSCQTQVNKWGMSQIVPRIKHKTGVRPGGTTEELSKRRKFNIEGEEIVQESKWIVKRKVYSESEKEQILSKVIEIGIRTTFRNHVYQ